MIEKYLAFYLLVGMLFLPVYLYFRMTFIWYIVPAIKRWNPDLSFKLALYFAGHGYYKYDGLMSFAEMKGYPIARVKYKDGYSTDMAIGNAIEYADMFNGEVVPA